MTAPLSRQQRRALERYAHGVDAITASDRRWFEEHPHRQFRIRRMAAAEIGSASAVLDGLEPVPDGSARFTLVRKLGPRSRMRIFIYGPAHKTGDETNDAICAALWEHHIDRDPAARERDLAVAAIVADYEHGEGGDAA